MSKTLGAVDRCRKSSSIGAVLSAGIVEHHVADVDRQRSQEEKGQPSPPL